MTESDLELYGIVGKMFREIRENNGHTLEYVSDFLGIAPKSLQRYECGERKIKVETIKSLCEFYNINCSSFMKEAKTRFIADIQSEYKENHTTKNLTSDKRLQGIIDCYYDMSEEGRDLLSKQAKFYLNEYKITKIDERAM